MPTFNEKSAVEDYIVDALVSMGWEFIPADELERESLEEPLLEWNLVRAIKRINSYLELTESDINRILVELKSRPTGAEGVKQILRYLKDGIAIKLEKSRELRYITLFDYKNIGNNEFIVSRQVRYESGNNKIRPDIVLYINGIPIVVIECKNPADPNVSWRDAYRQIKDYENKTPELFKYVQFSVAAEEDAKYFPNVRWLDDVHIYTWRKGDFDILDSTLELLSKEKLLDFIKNFIFTREERGKATKVIARYMQYEATNEIFNRVIKNLKGEESKKSGLIWHWQGSGKTLTMLFAANKLYREKLLENPTIFFIIDRRELEEQLYQEFSFLDIGIEPDRIESIKELKEALAHDQGRGKRGIIITLIHKFKPDELEMLEKELEQEKETILSRKNVIAFIDEGHRTQYGILAAEMRRILNNAFFFAFTGTPIAKRGKDTYDVFSYPKEGEPYLHKYFIRDSIRDGFTLPIIFQTKREEDINLDKERLNYFLSQELEEIPEEYRTDVESKIRKKLDTIRVILEDPGRIDFVAQDIAQHFKENIDGKFKGMVVAVDRLACIRFKRALDKYLPKEYSEVVMTFNRNDRKEILMYLEEVQKRHQGKEIEDIRKEIVEKFKEEEYPKLLIVTDMLLTGFDAPNLQVMYLYKPLKEHRLLQAIARTNRPYKDVKEAGLIIDYVGIFDKFQEAIAIYSKEDITDVAFNIDYEIKKFNKLIEELEAIFVGIEKNKYDRKTLMDAIRVLSEDRKNAKRFLVKYRELRRIFELLGPNPIKIDYVDRFKWLTAVYHTYNRHVKRSDPDEAERYARKYFGRTINYVYKTIEMGKIKEEFPILKLDENYLEKLENTFPDLESRVSDMIFTLNKYVLVDKYRNPIYESIADKVERIVRKWREREASLKETYENLENIFHEIKESNKRKRELALSTSEYYTLVILERKLGKSEKLIESVKELNKEIKGKVFKGWSTKPSSLKEVGIVVRRFLRKLPLSKEERDELHERIIKILKDQY